MSPITVAELRLFISGLSLTPFLYIYRAQFKKEHIKFFLVTGILGNGIPAFIFAWAVSKMDSSLAGVLNSLTPVFTLITGMFFFAFVPSKLRIFGVIIGLAGAVILILSRGSISSFDAFLPGLAIVFATFCYGLNINVTKRYLQNVNPFLISASSLFITGLPCFFLLIADNQFSIISQNFSVVWPSILSVATLALLGSAFALILYNKLIQMEGTLFVASVTYLMPIVSYIWGVLDNEVFGLVQFFGALLIILGVVLINRSYKLAARNSFGKV